MWNLSNEGTTGGSVGLSCQRTSEKRRRARIKVLNMSSAPLCSSLNIITLPKIRSCLAKDANFGELHRERENAYSSLDFVVQLKKLFSPFNRLYLKLSWQTR